MVTQAKKAKISHVQDEWFSVDAFKGIINKAHSKNTETSVFCLTCQRSVNVGHQGKKDLSRHCQSVSHVSKVNSKCTQPAINSGTFGFIPKSDPLETQIRKAEVKMVGFLAEHNLPIAVTDHIGPLVKDIFPNSKIAKGYQCAHTKATCILNGAIKPDLLVELITEMKKSCFSISADGSNNQRLEKINPGTVRLFDISQHKIVIKFLDMCLSKSSTAVGIFSLIDEVFQKNGIPWKNCISLGVDNTSVIFGTHKSLIVEARKQNANIILMGCPCHIAHNIKQNMVRRHLNKFRKVSKLKNCLWMYISILTIKEKEYFSRVL